MAIGTTQGTTDETAAPLTRRERQRQATYDEIVEIARRLLRDGQEVSIRAVAGEMGLTPPALYRYVDSAAALTDLVTRHIFVDVVATMAQARDAHPVEDPAAQIVAASTAFRAWALGNPAEFRMVLASPPPAPGSQPLEAQPHRPSFPPMSAADCKDGSQIFIDFFGEVFFRLWQQRRFPVPSPDQLEPAVVARWRESADSPKSGLLELLGDDGIGVLWLFELAWARLYGSVTLEVFGHLDPELSESGALFRAMLLEIGTSLGLADEWERLRGIAGYSG
jgi:AcrR family transcriptional regulator